MDQVKTINLLYETNYILPLLQSKDVTKLPSDPKRCKKKYLTIIPFISKEAGSWHPKLTWDSVISASLCQKSLSGLDEEGESVMSLEDIFHQDGFI